MGLAAGHRWHPVEPCVCPQPSTQPGPRERDKECMSAGRASPLLELCVMFLGLGVPRGRAQTRPAAISSFPGDSSLVGRPPLVEHIRERVGVCVRDVCSREHDVRGRRPAALDRGWRSL